MCIGCSCGSLPHCVTFLTVNIKFVSDLIPGTLPVLQLVTHARHKVWVSRSVTHGTQNYSRITLLSHKLRSSRHIASRSVNLCVEFVQVWSGVMSPVWLSGNCAQFTLGEQHVSSGRATCHCFVSAWLNTWHVTRRDNDMLMWQHLNFNEQVSIHISSGPYADTQRPSWAIVSLFISPEDHM